MLELPVLPARGGKANSLLPKQYLPLFGYDDDSIDPTTSYLRQELPIDGHPQKLRNTLGFD
jgi:hypothetical protein